MASPQHVVKVEYDLDRSVPADRKDLEWAFRRRLGDALARTEGVEYVVTSGGAGSTALAGKGRT